MKYIVIGLIVLVVLFIYMNFRKKNSLKRIIQAEWREKRNFSSKEEIQSVMSYWKQTSNHPGYHGVDSITWNDLAMDEVFHEINYTQSTVGSEFLYAQLHDIQLTDQQRKEPLYELLERNESLRYRIIFELKKLGKQNYINSFSFFEDNYKEIKHIWLYIILSLLPIASLLFTIINIKIGLVVFFVSMITNIFVYYVHKLSLDRYLYATTYVAGIITAGKRLAKIKERAFESYTNKLQQSIKPLRKFTMFENLMSLGKGTGDFEGLFDWFRTIFLVDIISYYFMISMLKKHGEKYQKIWNSIGEVDAGIAVAFYRHSIGNYCKPDFVEREEIVFAEMYHPLVKQPVKNSSHLHKLTLITGSNASGKSTYMKAVAINAILAQTINTALADRWTMKPSAIITSMAVQDNVIDGDSYFKAEIKSLNRIIRMIDSGVSVMSFIDEILRGTNTIERIAASASIMDWLSKHKGINLIASHDIELTSIAQGIYDNYHFHETVHNDGVYFDYKIHPGPSKTKNAIKLLTIMDYPAAITNMANSIADRFEDNREWESLNTLNKTSSLK